MLFVSVDSFVIICFSLFSLVFVLLNSFLLLKTSNFLSHCSFQLTMVADGWPDGQLINQSEQKSLEYQMKLVET